MVTFKVKSYVVIFLVSALILLPVFVSHAARGPRGGGAVEGPRGGEAIEGPSGNTAVKGPEGNIAVDRRVNTLPVTATPVVVGGAKYYIDGTVYYQADYSSGDVVYIVVPPPQ
jgi:hypothetical protein